ncbi:MAG TPA: TlpA disulfide reductase family protein [Marmoricola sp.]|jgi:thiol-disulfide isomerase/thioredoxin|nr:TlpA disulfide reductase family protein [Marmoricola sp.]
MRWLLAALVALALVATGCQADRAPQGGGGVDVDTPELRAVKAQAGIAPCAAPTGPKAEGGLPDVTLPCLGGGDGVDLARLRGPMVVNLFAQWCKPCREELPHYQAFHEKYGDRVAVLGVDWQDTQPLNALRLARETGVTYPLLADPDPQVRARGLPRLLLVDDQGRVAFDEYVEITSLHQLEDIVAEHLGVHP